MQNNRHNNTNNNSYSGISHGSPCVKHKIPWFTNCPPVCEPNSPTSRSFGQYVRLTIRMPAILAISHNGHLTYQPNGQPVCEFDLHTCSQNARCHCTKIKTIMIIKIKIIVIIVSETPATNQNGQISRNCFYSWLKRLDIKALPR